MAWSISNLFPTWGDTGEQPPTSFEYQGGDQVNEKHLDYLWDSVGTLEDETRSALTDIDSDGDGVVDEANLAQAAQSASTAFDLSGNALTDSTQGFLDLADGNDLRLATGKAIEDGSGISRIGLKANYTIVKTESGKKTLSASDGFRTRLYAYSNQPFDIYDSEGGFTAVQYDTDLSTGTLTLSNANLNLRGNEINNARRFRGNNEIGFDFEFLDGATVYFNTGGKSTTYQWFSADGAGNQIPTLTVDSTGRVDIPSGDLRLDTGQSIEDGSGTNRLELNSTFTSLLYEDGNRGIYLNDASSLDIWALFETPVRIKDNEGGFTAVEYTTDPSTGTLELSNAFLFADSVSTFSGEGNTAIGVGSNTSGSSKKITFDQGDGAHSYLQSVSGELKATDSGGQTTTLT